MTHHPPRVTRLFGLALCIACLAPMARAEDEDCAVPMADWQPRAAVQKMAQANGWHVRRIKIDDGCYEIYARDSMGRQIEIRVNPATLAVLGIEREDEEEREEHGSD